MKKNLRFLIISKICIILAAIAFVAGSASAQNYWSQINHPPTGDIRLISIAPDDGIFLSVWGDGIYYSDDGMNFSQINNGLTNLFVEAIEFDSSGNVLAGTAGGGVFISVNGTNWSELNSGLTNMHVQTIVVNQQGEYFAGTKGGGVFRMIEGREYWEQAATRMWYRDVSALTIASDSSIIAGTSGGGLYKTNNKGDHWRSAQGGLSSPVISAFAHSPNGSEIYAATTGGTLHMTVNNGADWAAFDTTDRLKNITGMVFNSDDYPIVATADSGIWYYNWVYEEWKKTEYRFSGVTDIAKTSDNVIWAAIPGAGLYKSINDGMEYTSVAFESRLRIRPLADFGNVIFAGSATPTDYDISKLYRSINNGKSWQEVAHGLDYPKMIVRDSLGQIYCAGNTNIARSQDNGASWILSYSEADTFGSIAVAPNNNAYACAMNNGYAYFLKSTDNGSTWDRTAINHEGTATTMAVDADGNIYIALYNNGMLRSTNEGQSWTRVLSGFEPPDPPIKVTSIALSGSGEIFAATDRGIRHSTDGGASWDLIEFTPNERYVDYVAMTHDDILYAAMMWRKGIFKSEDMGQTWDTVNMGLVQSNFAGLSAGTSGNIYIATSSLYRTVNESMMVPPDLISPGDNTGTIEFRPTVVWNTAPRAELYEVQLSTRYDFETINESVVLSDTSYRFLYELNYNTPYYWRVRSRTNSSFSAWSDVFQFTTGSKAPELVSPPDLSQGLDTELELIWNMVKDAQSYHLQVSINDDFTDLIFDDETLSDTTETIAGLELNTRYFWRVRGINGALSTRWSEEWMFVTKLEAPELVSPNDGSYGQPEKVTLQWEIVPSATGYTVQIARDAEFMQMIFDGDAEQATTHQIDLLEPFTTYYWHIAAKNDGGRGVWSETWSFTTSLETPVLISPEDESTDQPVNIELTWQEHPNAEYYQLLVAMDEDFEEIIIDEQELVTLSYLLENLEYSERYFWKIRAKNGDYLSEWSEVWSFMTGLGKTYLKTPEDGATDQIRTMYLYWEPVTGADEYEFQLNDENNFDGELIYDINDVKNTRYSVSSLDYSTEFFWRVRAKNEYGVGEWSDVWSFMTLADPNSVAEEPMIDGFAAAVYPNPFAGRANIEYRIAKAANVTIEVIDIRGNKLATLDNGAKAGGTHRLVWDAINAPDGVYYLRFTVDGRTFVRELILRR
ncbi:MAG: T9SS type A sorting domain-containing protein [Candidatus Kapaibacterium sp.]